MRITESKLRRNLYQILDEVIATGTPVEIVRKGRVLRIIPGGPSKLARLKKRTGFDGDPGEIVGVDWLGEWTSNNRLAF